MKYFCMMLFFIMMFPAYVYADGGVGHDIKQLGSQISEKYGGTLYDQAASCAICEDGNLLFTGYAASADGDLKGVSKGGGYKDLWILKIDPSNNGILYNKCFGGSEDDEGYSIAESSDGNIVVVGATVSKDGDLKGIRKSLKGDADLWLLKIDPKNNRILYNKCFGGTDSDIGTSLCLLSDGCVAITGYTYSMDGDLGVPGNAGDCDLWVLKVDMSNNNILYNRTFGGSEYDAGSSIIESRDRNLVIIGDANSTNASLAKAGNHGGQDLWLLKIDPKSDRVLYNRCFGGSDMEVGKAIMEVPGGHIVAVGSTSSVDKDLSGVKTEQVDRDVWVLKIDISNNKILYNCSFGGSGIDSANSVTDSSNGDIVVGGYTYSNDRDLAGAQYHGGGDAWMIRINMEPSRKYHFVSSRCFGGSGDDQANSIVRYGKNYIIFGTTSSKDGHLKGAKSTGDKEFADWMLLKVSI